MLGYRMCSMVSKCVLFPAYSKYTSANLTFTWSSILNMRLLLDINSNLYCSHINEIALYNNCNLGSLHSFIKSNASLSPAIIRKYYSENSVRSILFNSESIFHLIWYDSLACQLSPTHGLITILSTNFIEPGLCVTGCL